MDANNALLGRSLTVQYVPVNPGKQSQKPSERHLPVVPADSTHQKVHSAIPQSTPLQSKMMNTKKDNIKMQIQKKTPYHSESVSHM